MVVGWVTGGEKHYFGNTEAAKSSQKQVDITRGSVVFMHIDFAVEPVEVQFIFNGKELL